MKSALVLLAIVFASTLAADPVITSVSPTSGPVSGGITVTIKGTGFNNNCIICSPPFAGPLVYFGVVPAASVRFVDSTTLEAVTPPHFAGTTSIVVHLLDGSEVYANLPDAFTFAGKTEDAFDPILFPVFLPPIDGAFGSKFETTPRLAKLSGSDAAVMYGYDTSCYLFSPHISADMPRPIGSGTLLTGCSQTTGRVLYISKGTRVAANLRVRDTSRQASSHGVEVPVVKRSDFSNDRIMLLGVPVDPRFRNTLRIYSLDPGEVLVNIAVNGTGIGQVFLTPSTSPYEPAYAEFTNFPANLPAGSTMDVTLAMGKLPDGSIAPNTPSIWGFISVTNNDTQEITVISPQP